MTVNELTGLVRLLLRRLVGRRRLLAAAVGARQGALEGHAVDLE